MRTAPLRRAPKGVLRGCAKGVPGGVTLRSRYPKRPVSASSACTSATATPLPSTHGKHNHGGGGAMVESVPERGARLASSIDMYTSWTLPMAVADPGASTLPPTPAAPSQQEEMDALKQELLRR